jgi:hypothetical protein
MSSVAFWYQTEPHKPWPPLPPGGERLPFHDQVLLKGHEAAATARHSAARVQLQNIGGTTDGQQLWFQPHEDMAWVEIPFTLDKAQKAELFCKMVHSWDYGIYEVKLDGQTVAKLDLYSPSVTPTAHKLGLRTLSAGTHVLRFEGIGKSPASAGYFLGFDALAVRVPAYARAPSEDLRKLQKTQ